jgi:hypothetical protein
VVVLAAIVAMIAPDSHVAAARAAAVAYRVDPLVLLAIAEHETRWQSELTNGRSCGAMQVATSSAGQCRAMADVTLAYLEGARVLSQWLHASGGDLPEALAHYACGNVAKHHDCRGFAHWVIERSAAYGKAARS